jgi:hypothetical protein
LWLGAIDWSVRATRLWLVSIDWSGRALDCGWFTNSAFRTK